jgi:alpha-D-xyloside xylohydrolase
MKFTDGQWLLQNGVNASYACEAYEVETRKDELVVLATTRRIQHRGDTLQGPILTVTLSSPLEGVIKVRIEHFSGGALKRPLIPLVEQPAPAVKMFSSESEASLSSGPLSARVQRGANYELSFRADDRVLTRSGWRGQGYAQWAGKGNFVHEQLSLGVGENVYGLGERFTAFVKNGQLVENWNKDGGTSSEQTYKNVPFYLTNGGYGVLVNETGPIDFEIASEKVARVQFSLPGESLEYFVIYGPSPKEILARLTALTGRPALPPAWSFGLWLSTSFTTNYDEATVTRFIKGMEERKLPLSVFHFDCFWMKEFEWCNFEFDSRQFPDPKGFIARIKAHGLHVCVWINPYVAQRSPLFEEGRKGGFFLKRADGGVWQSDLWQPGMAIVDFTNPAARDWFSGKLRRLMELGVDCFKTDFGERIPTDVVYHDGSDPVAMHNLYSIQYNETVFNLLEKERGKGEAVVFARSTYASGQRFPLHWGGDCWSNFESMAESLRGGLSLSLCGFGFWSHDIGGFEGNPPPSLYKRWLAFGLLSSHSRLHGSSTYRVPWSVDEESCDVLRFFTNLKCELMPYWYAMAVEAHRKGVPMMRAMMLEFPGDPACESLDRQYMLGDSLLVAPVFSPDNNVSYYLPEGRWTHLLTGEVQAGGRWYRASHGFLSLPLFVRHNTVIALGQCKDRPDYDYADKVRFRVYELADGASANCSVHSIGGAQAVSCTVTRKGSRLSAHCSGAKVGNWSLELVGIKKAKSAAGDVAINLIDLGVQVTPSRGSKTLDLELTD